jgi:hypothetical protein
MKRTPLRRKTPLRARKRLTATPRSVPPDVREAVLRRDGGCVAPGAFGIGCGGPLDPHHRVTKGMGGKRAPDTVDDLITLCRRHHDYVTEHPADAIAAGLSRRRNR